MRTVFLVQFVDDLGPMSFLASPPQPSIGKLGKEGSRDGFYAKWINNEVEDIG